MVARSEIERRVGDGIVKGVGEAYATIADRAKIDPILGDVFSVSPGNIVGNVVDRSHTAYVVCLAIWRKHETETDVISRTVTGTGEGLARVAIANVVHQIVVDHPGVSGRDTKRMAPQRRGFGIREPLGQCRMINDRIRPDKQVLVAVECKVKSGVMVV